MLMNQILPNVSPFSGCTSPQNVQVPYYHCSALAERIEAYQSAWYVSDTSDSIAGLDRWLLYYRMYQDISADDSLYADSTLNVIWNKLDTISSIIEYDAEGNPLPVAVNIAGMNQLERALENNDTVTAASLLGSLSPAFGPEQKLFNVFQVEYEILDGGNDTLTADQEEVLYSIAALCPDNYGSGVFRARALLASFGIFEDWGDCGFGKRDEVESKQELKVSDKDAFIVYPNPTTGTLTFLFGQYPVNATIRMYDLMGHELVSQQVHETSFTVVDLGTWSGGVYIYQVDFEGINTQNGQIILIREE